MTTTTMISTTKYVYIDNIIGDLVLEISGGCGGCVVQVVCDLARELVGMK